MQGELSTLAWILTSTLIVSAISLIGILFLSVNQNLFRKMLLVLVSFASGTLLGGAFLHLIPEALLNGGENLFIVILSGILVFFLLEKFLWRHCHERDCPVHVFAYLNLLGDGIHNFIDGILIAASFLTSTPLGFATALAVVSHEIPQEIGDFGILVYGGFSKVKALSYNLLSALMAFVGALLTYSFSAYLPSSSYFLMFAAGSFIYVATTDLIPELHKEHGVAKSFLQFALLVVGMSLMWFLRA
ncbi:MAG: ZIP family metal transporter [Candidatus Bathyarchaeota archaeon]|nr:ZIP family metal transporter [Candidatus Bathyarchaeota archaeon]